jgi:hypothetical protein
MPIMAIYLDVFGPPNSSSTKQMIKLKWFNDTIKHITILYLDLKKNYKQKDKIRFEYIVKKIVKYCDKVVRNVVTRAGNKQVCRMDFLMNDVSKTSLK